MLEQMQNFYLTNYPDRMFDSKEYRIVVQQIYTRYPSTKRCVCIKLSFQSGNCMEEMRMFKTLAFPF